MSTREVLQAIELAVATETEGGTCPASALAPYYKRKKVVKTFIICTDEEENMEYKMNKSKKPMR